MNFQQVSNQMRGDVGTTKQSQSKITNQNLSLIYSITTTTVQEDRYEINSRGVKLEEVEKNTNQCNLKCGGKGLAHLNWLLKFVLYWVELCYAAQLFLFFIFYFSLKFFLFLFLFSWTFFSCVLGG